MDILLDVSLALSIKQADRGVNRGLKGWDQE